MFIPYIYKDEIDASHILTAMSALQANNSDENRPQQVAFGSRGDAVVTNLP